MTDFSLKSEPAHLPRQHVDALDSLQKDMLDALQADQVKKQLNDAKLRGVKQRVEYDDFEKLVKGAHLRPVKPRTAELDEIGKQFDGFVMPKLDATVAGPKLPPTPSAALVQPTVPSVPKTSNEFLRVWRRQLKGAEQRYAYIRQLDPEALSLLFRTELDAQIFDGIVGALGERLLREGDGEEEVSKGDCEASSSSSSSPAAAASVEAAAVDVSAGEGAANVAAPEAAAAAPATEARRADLAWAFSFLQQASRLNRFDLTLDFADAATTATLSNLLDAIGAEASRSSAAGHGMPDAASLAALRTGLKAS